MSVYHLGPKYIMVQHICTSLLRTHINVVMHMVIGSNVPEAVLIKVNDLVEEVTG